MFTSFLDSKIEVYVNKINNFRISRLLEVEGKCKHFPEPKNQRFLEVDKIQSEFWRDL